MCGQSRQYQTSRYEVFSAMGFSGLVVDITLLGGVLGSWFLEACFNPEVHNKIQWDSKGALAPNASKKNRPLSLHVDIKRHS